MTALPRSGELQNERLTPLVFFGAIAIAATSALGGSTHGGFLSDAILELVTLPPLFAVLWRLSREATLPLATRRALVFCAALAAVPLLQLVPLPPLVWAHLPGHAAVAEAYRLVDPNLPWAGISLTPTDTAQAGLSLIPAFTVFGATLLANTRERRLLSLLVIVLGIAQAFLGLAQIAQGPPSPLRPFDVTSHDVAVGLFANRNHFAAALYCAIALATAWAAAGTAAALKPRRARSEAGGPFVVILLAVIAIAVLVIGVLITRSRAGLLLMLLALTSGLALAPWRQIEWRSRLSGRAIAGLAVVAIAGIVVLGQLSLLATLQRFTVEAVPSDRLTLAVRTLDIARTTLPLGTGVGSFVPIFAMHETPADMQVNVFTNHAHNDAAETLLETGVIGPLLLILFSIWLVRAARRIWRKPYFQGHDVDRALGRAATVLLGLLAVHSLVDYPLRTGAIMAIVAFACGTLFEPLYAQVETVASTPEAGRPRRRRMGGPNVPRPLRL